MSLRISTWLISIGLLSHSCAPAAARARPHADMPHPRSTLFAAGLEARQVVPASDSSGSGSATFVLSVSETVARLAYELTFDRLRRSPRSIQLRNFGAGGNGEIVHVICGPASGGESTSCPASLGGTLSGAWTSQDRLPLTPDLLRELSAERIYIEIETGSAQHEIRGQLLPQLLFAGFKSFVVSLRGGQPPHSNVSGTGAFHLVTIDSTHRIFLYQLTVTGLTAAISEVHIVGPRQQRLTIKVPQRNKEQKAAATIFGRTDANELPLLRKADLPASWMNGKFRVTIVTADKRGGVIQGKLVPLL